MNTSAIDSLFTPWTGESSPGAVWAVTRGGREIHSGAVGMADIAHAVPLDRRSVIRIGSQTKQFTVLLALMLEREGKLAMQDEVHRYCPWLPGYPAPITLQPLATNSSGLRDFLEIMTYAGVPLAGPATRARQRELIARHAEVNFPPGAQMIYCNTGFWLLSEIIEQVSGRGYNELLHERITGPLGMADTRLMINDADILPRLASHHARGPDDAWQTARWGWAIGGEGGMVSTLDDMLIWQANLARPRVGDAATFERMATTLTYTNGVRGLYAMGLSNAAYRGQRAIGHGGGVAGGRSESLRFPDIDGGVVILANHLHVAPYSLACRIADIAFADALTPRPPGGGAETLARMTGLYRHEGGGDIFALTHADGVPGLVTSAGDVVLDEIEPGVFAPERVTMHMTLAPDGEALRVTSCGEAQRYIRLAPPAGPFPDITGRYGSAAAGLAATVRADAGGLRMVIGSEHGLHRLQLRWIDRDLLAGLPDGRADGRAASDGWPPAWNCTIQVTGSGLVLTTDRTKHLALTRL
jgi:D-aminopeptidase